MEDFIRSITLETGSDESIGKGRVKRIGLSLSALLPEAALLLFSLLLGSYSPFDGVSPFGVACVFAAWYTGLDPYAACAGALIGYLISGNFAYAVPCLALGVLIRLVSFRRKPKRIYRLLAAFAADAALNAVSALIFGKSLLLFVSSSAVSVLGAVVIGQGLRAGRAFVGGRSLSDAEIVTLSALAGIVSLSFGRIDVFGQSPAVIFGCICSLIAANRLGVPAAAAAVAVGAGHCFATGGDMHYIAVIVFVSLAAASVRSLGKWAVLAAFALLSCFITAFIRGNGVIGYIECGIACLVFAVIPQKLYLRDPATGRTRQDPRLLRLQYRVASLSEVLSEFSRVLGGDEGRLIGRVSDSLKRSLNADPRASADSITIKVGSAARTKRGSRRSGDSFAVREIDGKLLVSISDGMGTGDAAEKESRAATALLSDLLKVGFTLEEASDCVNSLLEKRCDGDMYATLDAILIDRADGTAWLSKHGAPPSVIVRGGKPGLVGAEALPVGIIRDAGAGMASLKLKQGDTVVMTSDGVSDALGSGLASFAAKAVKEKSADDAARMLLDEACARGADDDMTVLIIKLRSVTRKSR